MQNETTLKAGATMSFRKTMTVAEQAFFTGISGNLATMHVDAAAARDAGFANMLSFEMAVLALASTCLNRMAGKAWRLGKLDLVFDAPVVVGSTIEAIATVSDVTATALTFDVRCMIDTEDGGKQVIGGTAAMLPLSA
jgi:acyl dehydratase